jgi:hypothetical protein
MFGQLTARLARSGLATGTSVLTLFGTLSRTWPDRDPLDIYLNDHLLGATLGAELAARIASAHRASLEGPTLERIAAEISEDRAALKETMEALGVPIRGYKVALGWVAEKAGRLKPNGHLLERSALSDLEELEAMRLGVEGKAAGWRTLRALADRDHRLETVRLDALIARARRQASTLEEIRVRTAERLVP